jgi:hypothetical protein
MARKLLRQFVTIATGLILTATMLVGVGWWRRAPAARPLDDLRAACAVQRSRQRVMFGAFWRQGGEDTARCGFELARMQLVPSATSPAILERYGVDGGFDVSNREHQNRFLNACLSAGTHPSG